MTAVCLLSLSSSWHGNFLVRENEATTGSPYHISHTLFDKLTSKDFFCYQESQPPKPWPPPLPLTLHSFLTLFSQKWMIWNSCFCWKEDALSLISTYYFWKRWRETEIEECEWLTIEMNEFVRVERLVQTTGHASHMNAHPLSSLQLIIRRGQGSLTRDRGKVSQESTLPLPKVSVSVCLKFLQTGTRLSLDEKREGM